GGSRRSRTRLHRPLHPHKPLAVHTKDARSQRSQAPRAKLPSCVSRFPLFNPSQFLRVAAEALHNLVVETLPVLPSRRKWWIKISDTPFTSFLSSAALAVRAPLYAD